MDFKELKPKTEGLYDSCYKTNDREELKEIALNAIYVAHNNVDIINELLDRLGEDEKIEYLQDLMKFKKAPYDFVANNYTSMPIELLREIALNAVYVANDDKAVQKEIDDRKIEENNTPTEEEWVGKMKDTNGTFFDVYQHGDKFYDVLGNELDKEEVKNFVIKNTKTESVMDLPNGQDDCNSFKNYQAFVNNFGELIILRDKYDKNWKVYKPTRTEPNDYIYYADSRDNIEGWLYGAVMASNGIFKDLKSENKQLNEDTISNGYIVARYDYLRSDREHKYNSHTLNKDEAALFTEYEDAQNAMEEANKNVKQTHPNNEATFNIFKANELKENKIVETEKFTELKPITEADEYELTTTKQILKDVKNKIDTKLKDVFDTQFADAGDVVGLKLTRKKDNIDLISIFDTIVKSLSSCGLDKKDYELDLKGNDLVLAMNNIAR